jgi:hypothetical protein
MGGEGCRLIVAGVVGLLVGFLVGKQWGWRALAQCLFAEGYSIVVNERKLHGEGRFTVKKHKVPF